VVQDLRLSFPDESPAVDPLLWSTSRSSLLSGSHDELRLPAGFAVAGRAADQLFIEFGTDKPKYFIPEARDYTVRIDARLGHVEGWRPLLTFTLHVARITRPSNYIAYRNSLEGMTEEDHAKAVTALRAVAAKVETTLEAHEGNGDE
jgi:hypothetical protein